MRYTWIIPPFEGLAFKKQVRFRVFYSILIVQIDVALLIPKYLVFLNLMLDQDTNYRPMNLR